MIAVAPMVFVVDDDPSVRKSLTRFTSPGRKSWCFSGTSCGSSAGRSSCSGMAGRFTGAT
jgi:hypothetical protein